MYCKQDVKKYNYYIWSKDHLIVIQRSTLCKCTKPFIDPFGGMSWWKLYKSTSSIYPMNRAITSWVGLIVVIFLGAYDFHFCKVQAADILWRFAWMRSRVPTEEFASSLIKHCWIHEDFLYRVIELKVIKTIVAIILWL